MSVNRTADSIGVRRIPVALIIAASNVALMLFGVGSSVVLSRLLGPEERGIFVAWQTWAIVLGTVGVLGAPQSLVLPTSQSAVPRLPKVIQFLGCTTIATSFLVAMAIVSLGGGWIPILAGCLTVAATQIGSFLPSLAQREGRLRVAFNAYRLTPQIVGLMAAGCCWIFLERDAAMWLLVISASQFVAVSILFVIEFMRDRVYSRSLRHLWRESWRIAPASWSSLLQYRVDMLVVAALLPPSQIAFYAIGVAVQNAVFSVGQSTGMKMFSDRARGRTLLTRRLLQATGARLLVLALGCSVAAWFMVPVVYGPDYTQARTVAAILALSGAAQSLDYLIWHQLIGNVPSRILLLIRVPSIAMLVTFVVITSLQPDAAILAAGGTLVSNWLAVAFMMCVSLNRKKMKVDD